MTGIKLASLTVRFRRMVPGASLAPLDSKLGSLRMLNETSGPHAATQAETQGVDKRTMVVRLFGVREAISLNSHVTKRLRKGP